MVLVRERRPKMTYGTIDILRLTPRQAEAFDLIVLGLMDREIANTMGVSHSRARQLVGETLRKLKVHGRRGLLALLWREIQRKGAICANCSDSEGL